MFANSAYEKGWKLSEHTITLANSMKFPLIMYSKIIWPYLVWHNRYLIWMENVWWLAVIISPVARMVCWILFSLPLHTLSYYYSDVCMHLVEQYYDHTCKEQTGCDVMFYWYFGIKMLSVIVLISSCIYHG